MYFIDWKGLGFRLFEQSSKSKKLSIGFTRPGKWWKRECKAKAEGKVWLRTCLLRKRLRQEIISLVHLFTHPTLIYTTYIHSNKGKLMRSTCQTLKQVPLTPDHLLHLIGKDVSRLLSLSLFKTKGERRQRTGLHLKETNYTFRHLKGD